MYLQYINNKEIERFAKRLNKNITKVIIVPNNDRTAMYVFTDLLDVTLYITDFECINTETSANYSRLWRKFMLEQLDKKLLGDQYIDYWHSCHQQKDCCEAII